MSDSGIIFDPQKPKASVQGIATLDFDVLIDENHEWSDEITSNPVENGSPISDHIIPNADKYRMTVMITDSSLYDNLTDGSDSKTQKAFDTIRQLRDDRKTVTVYTKYITYNDMGISHIGSPRSGADGDSLIFSIEFQRIRITNTQTVKVPAGISKKLDKKSTDSVKKKTEPQKTTGAKQPVQPPEKQRSVLSGLLGGA